MSKSKHTPRLWERAARRALKMLIEECTCWDGITSQMDMRGKHYEVPCVRCGWARDLIAKAEGESDE